MERLVSRPGLRVPDINLSVVGIRYLLGACVLRELSCLEFRLFVLIWFAEIPRILVSFDWAIW